MNKFQKQVNKCKGSTAKGRFNAFDKQDKVHAAFLGLARATGSMTTGNEYKPLLKQIEDAKRTVGSAVDCNEDTARFAAWSGSWKPTNQVRF